jgi:hypothetical protein
MFCAPKALHTTYPVLKAKAAESRHLVPALCHVVAGLAKNNDHDGHMVAVLKSLLEFYMILEEPGPYLSVEQVGMLKATTDRVLWHYTWLAQWALGRGLKRPVAKPWVMMMLLACPHRWNIVPKFHYMWHIADMAKFMNPRWAWTYMDEDFVGKMAVVGEACSNGTHAVAISRTMLQKYRAGMYLRMSRAVA